MYVSNAWNRNAGLRDRFMKKNTRSEIVEVALDLFSVNGYEATSLSQIADRVGIRKASLYSHFESKQAILDEIGAATIEHYNTNSVLINADWNDPEFVKSLIDDATPEAMIEKIKQHIYFVTHDPYMYKVRKMIIIEQFRNEFFAKHYNDRSYNHVLDFYTKYMETLIEAKVFKPYDPRVMAMQFASPISVWISVWDRDAAREEEILDFLEKHIKLFFEVYKL